MFALNLNKIPMPIFYGKAALIDYLKSIKTQILQLVSFPQWVHYIKDLMQQSLAENDTTG
jgi:pantoate--beta-alanine ligase